MADRATKYAQDVVDGKIVTGEPVWASCQRHLEDLQREDIYFDEEAAQYAIDFFEEMLYLNGGQFEGKPFLLAPCQDFIIGSVFGWKRRDGTRRFRRAYIEMGKGNGKSPLIGGIGLFGLVPDKEPRAEIYAAATKKDQAKILYNDAVAMVEYSPDLHAVIGIGGGEANPQMTYHQRGSFFKPIANDSGKSGPRPHMALVDELHEHPDRDTLEMLERGFKFRLNPLLVMITNSGFDTNTVCYEEHVHATNVAFGIVEDDTTFSYVCQVDEDDDPLTDPSCWIKANPMLGTILTEEYLAGVVKQANTQAGKKNGILRLHFCVWTEAESVWIERAEWEKVQVNEIEPHPDAVKYGGIDLSSITDLTAACDIYKNPDGTYDAELFFWTPAEGLREKEKTDKVPYVMWRDEGYIFTSPGKRIKYSSIMPWLGKSNGKQSYAKIGFDPWKMSYFESDMDAAGIEIDVEGVHQGFKTMSPAIGALEDLIDENRIRIKYNPALNFAVASAMVTTDPAGNRKFDKAKSKSRIDGLLALVIAVHIAENEEYVNIDAVVNNPVKGRY